MRWPELVALMALATVRVAAARANGHTIRREEIETRVLEEIPAEGDGY